MKRVAVGYEFICRIIMMVFVAHVAFLVHTLMGVVVAGFFPSIAAACSTFRTWFLDARDRSWSIRQTWTTFHKAWKEEFKQSNIFGWPQFLVWALLVWEYWLTMNNYMGTMGIIISGLLLLLNLFYGLFVFISWAVRANFNEGPMWVVRTSLTMVIARPLCSVMVLALFIITIWLYYTWPGLMIAFGLAVPLFLVMATVYSWGRLPGMDIHEVDPSHGSD